MREFDFTLQQNMFGKTNADAKLIHPTRRELSAVAYFCSEGYRPMVSNYPNYHFLEKSTGKQVDKHIDDLLHLYDQDMRERTRTRAQERAKAKGEQRRVGW